jgi:hypothetical protein
MVLPPGIPITQAGEVTLPQLWLLDHDLAD